MGICTQAENPVVEKKKTNSFEKPVSQSKDNINTAPIDKPGAKSALLMNPKDSRLKKQPKNYSAPSAVSVLLPKTKTIEPNQPNKEQVNPITTQEGTTPTKNNTITETGTPLITSQLPHKKELNYYKSTSKGNYIIAIYETNEDNLLIDIMFYGSDSLLPYLNIQNCTIKYEENEYEVAYKSNKHLFAKKGRHTVIIRFHQQLTDIFNLFAGCKCLRECNLSKFDFSKIKNISNCFNHCVNLIKVDGTELLNTSSFTAVDTVKNAFLGCEKLKYIKIKKQNCGALLKDIQDNHKSYESLEIVYV